ncbi:molybdenum ABC transporter ATP-binding protein [Siculibacillus lacustris]|uniref:Molybdenum ABC transporter ATP-binding protein n=1 Tax=Siculibacillus lacustris TaxID=1549641 RepID=A0A4Q9VLF9_9HYPH|nr:TOBE domain-containing protein [Siculibacillus lacustris]TBW35831.1 molybdenum ABC transporter ATP-binding protein [Siculibacillus lacustris]
MIRLSSRFHARVTRHDTPVGLSNLFFGDGEFRVPIVPEPIGTGVTLEIDARDVSVALSRPMDVSITNRFPGTIVEIEHLEAPYARVTFDLGSNRLHALVTWESVERLALEPGLRAWAMIKSVAISASTIAEDPVDSPPPPAPRAWPRGRSPDRPKR